MHANPTAKWRLLVSFCVVALTAVALLAWSGAPALAQKNGTKLKIGTTDPGSGDAKKDQADLETLQKFIKDETGFDNEIIRFKDSPALAAKLASGEIQLAAMQGIEFARAKAANPSLKPLAVAVNRYVYPEAHIVTKKGDSANSIGGLKGQAFAMPKNPQGFLSLFLEKQTGSADPSKFFGSVKSAADSAKALDTVVDGEARATIVDKASLEDYQKQKPGRAKDLNFNFLVSAKLAPPLIVYGPDGVKQAQLDRIKKGLLDANKKERGRTQLEYFRLTSFQEPPADLSAVLESSLKEYPAKK
jgi:ABC-type phosphate/phosphonate transport system substrate-binding protein